MIDEDKKFLKLLELLGHYQERGSVIIFVDKQEHADALLKDLMKASYPCMSLHGGEDILVPRCRIGPRAAIRAGWQPVLGKQISSSVILVEMFRL